MAIDKFILYFKILSFGEKGVKRKQNEAKYNK